MESTYIGKTIGIHVRCRIQQGEFHGHVHSVFERACNLLTHDKQLFSLAIPSVGSSGYGVLIQERAGMGAPFQKLCVGDRFFCLGHNILFAGSYGIDISQAEVWIAKRAQSSNLLEVVIRQNLERCRAALHHHQSVSGWNGYIHKIQVAVPLLQKSFAERNTRAAAEAALSVLGCGPGLTPGGDDFLTGWISGILWGAAAFRMERSEFFPCIQAIVTQAEAKTTLISFTQLLHAALDELPEKIQALLWDLYQSADERVVNQSIEQVVNIGHTSGRDILVGMAAAMNYMLEQEYPERQRTR